MVPPQTKVSSGTAEKATMHRPRMTAMVALITTAARAGVPRPEIRPRPPLPKPSLLIANSSRAEPTVQARQQPKALIVAPRVTRLPTQGLR